ncbi:MAG: YebC/PmpR family DNA-binding transcriptional regulator [Candidatus Coatesbacteria bacterium]|nr:YebC/PmpR family DNA-binding transcriptional regulator [Candidatus Coatesbacteria bacterium]
MSGHSKWSTIKRKKEAADKKRGKIFTRLIREITIAAREGGGDPEANPRLRTAVDNAQTQNMPKDNIKRAIQRGTGELPGMVIEEHLYEGYGPGGVAVIVETISDNNNRTTSEIRHLFDKYDGHLAKSGAASYSFDRRGLIVIDGSTDEDLLMEVALEAGALDIITDEDAFEVLTEYNDYHQVNEALNRAGFKILESSLAYIPQNEIRLDDDDDGEKVLKLLEALEEQDDVQNVYTNYDIPDDVEFD